MRFFDVHGVVGKARRFVSGSASVQDEEVRNPAKLAEVLRGSLRRLAELEARVSSEGAEYEVEVSTGGSLHRIQHNLNGPVRFTVVYWTKPRATGAAYPTAGPSLAAHESSTANTLVLRSTVAGRAIIRIESSQNGVPFTLG